jgi:hypothetical protein
MEGGPVKTMEGSLKGCRSGGTDRGTSPEPLTHGRVSDHPRSFMRRVPTPFSTRESLRASP